MYEGVKLRLIAIVKRLRVSTKIMTAAMVAASFGQPAFSQSPPGDFDTISAEAAAARAQGDIPGAIQLYRQAVELNPQWLDGWWFLGILQYGADQYAPAIDALTHFIALTPNGGAAIALRGLCEFETGQYPEALQDIQHGISLGAANQPRNAQILFYHEALLLTRLGRFEEAIGKYTIFVRQGQINPDLTTAIGLAGLRIPLLPKDADPGQAELISMVGQAAIAVMNRNPDAGRQAFQAVFDRFPKAPNVHYFYGYLLFAIDPDQSAAQFRLELAVVPSSASAHAMLAWISELQGNFAAALPDAEKAAAEDPSLLMDQLVLGRAMVETGNVSGGLPHLEAVLRMDPDNLEAHLTLAKAYSKLGRRDDARKERLLCLTLSDQGAVTSATQ